MDSISSGFIQAFRLIVTLDPEVLEISARTLQVSGIATLVSVLIGFPVGTVLALTRFFGRGLLVSIVNFGMGLPPVVVGFVTWLLLMRYGPLGALGLLYSPTAMIIAQAVIASPIVAGFTLAAVQSIDPKLRLQILSLGTTRIQYLLLLLWESRPGHSGCRHSRIWARSGRGRRIHDGRRQYSRLYKGAHHGDRARSLEGRIRTGGRVEHHPACAFLFHNGCTQLSPATRKAAVNGGRFVS